MAKRVDDVLFAKAATEYGDMSKAADVVHVEEERERWRQKYAPCGGMTRWIEMLYRMYEATR